MTNTFLNKVSAERRVLKIVNTRFKRKQQLTGLSRPAIQRWQSLVGVEPGSLFSLLLFSLADQCQSLSDRSNETFAVIETERVELVNESIEELKSAVNEFALRQ